jgi:hypothetical protein
LSIFDSEFLAREILTSTTRKTAAFFLILFSLSLAVSSTSRVVKICKEAPDLIYSATGTLVFEKYALISPDTLKIIDGTKINRLGTLVSGIKLSQNISYPIDITIGSDKALSAAEGKNTFIHIGKNALTTNVLSALFGYESQKTTWDRILKTPNITIDEIFYKNYFSKFSNKIGFWVMGFIVIGIQMFQSILQVWLSIFIYLLFFGKKLRLIEKIRLLMLTFIPYFIIMPVSLFAAKGILFTTDISLLCAVILTIRAIVKVDKICVRKDNNEII